LKNGIVTDMISETAKLKIDEQSREELIALIYEMTKEISELKAEIGRLRQPPTTSQNSSQPPSRDFKAAEERNTRETKRKVPSLSMKNKTVRWWTTPTKLLKCT
jgi:hypothetical protein